MNVLKSTMVSTTSRDDLIGRWSSITILFFALLLVLVATLFPFDFSFKEVNKNSDYYFFFLGWERLSTLDVLNNFMLFLPLGFGLAGCLILVVRVSWLTSLVVTILLSFGLSYTVEILQLFVPLRSSSLIDVLSNGTSGLFGFFCFRLWECKGKAVDYALDIVKKNLLLSFFGYATLVCFVTIFFQQFSSLSNWDKTYPLLLGNERTGDRPWSGYISEVYILDRALTREEIAVIFSKKASIASIEDSLLVSYQLTGLGNYNDKIGRLPALVWRGKPEDARQDKGDFLNRNHWLETTASATYLTQRIVETSQFTLGIIVATGDTVQTGPARIISLSEDTGHRNFTLGQQGNDLIFRLRTPFTGENGVNPAMVVSDVFSTTYLHNLVIIYNGSVLIIYIDGMINPHALNFDLGGISFSYLLNLNTFFLACYKILYYIIIFIPLGILLLLTVKMMKNRFLIQIIVISGCILLPSFIFEGILVYMNGRAVMLENLFVSMTLIAVPIVFLRYVNPHLLEKRKT